ncbi:HRDC domain-containing protein [Clostridium hydrogenum]|uniref:HRDC domain-containing protein n=1 Tax=Clostridium hydrogenum TaxID=2855764 RepID=UPI001F1C3181|nr:HRDC domain-containing protein [Clostridium hydrogenum]
MGLFNRMKEPIFLKESSNAEVQLEKLKTLEPLLNSKYAKKEVKAKVIRADQLVKYIKEMYESSKLSVDSDEKMLAWAQSYLDLHNDIEKDYTGKYEKYKINILTSQQLAEETEAQVGKVKSAIVEELPVEETEIFKELKTYRLDKSHEEKIKPYYIYNNNQLKDLISKMPRNKEELKMIAGFGDVKANKYGDDILNIIKKY